MHGAIAAPVSVGAAGDAFGGAVANALKHDSPAGASLFPAPVDAALDVFREAVADGVDHNSIRGAGPPPGAARAADDVVAAADADDLDHDHLVGTEFAGTPSPLRTPRASGTAASDPDTNKEGDPLRFLLSAPEDLTQRRRERETQFTDDVWKVPLSMIEDVPKGATPSSRSVLSPLDAFNSTLTLKAVRESSDVLQVPPRPGSQRNLCRRAASSQGAPADQIVTVDQVPVFRSDLVRLVPGAWLTDQVVNAFVELLRNHPFRYIGGAEGGGGHDRFFFFNSYFYSMIRLNEKYKHSRVRRRTSSKHVLASEKVFVPHIIGNLHWDLAVIELSEGVVAVYESLG